MKSKIISIEPIRNYQLNISLTILLLKCNLCWPILRSLFFRTMWHKVKNMSKFLFTMKLMLNYPRDLSMESKHVRIWSLSTIQQRWRVVHVRISKKKKHLSKRIRDLFVCLVVEIEWNVLAGWKHSIKRN